MICNWFPSFVVAGGTYTEVGDHSCTHLVIEENTVIELLSDLTGKVKQVKQEVCTQLLVIYYCSCTSLSFPKFSSFYTSFYICLHY